MEELLVNSIALNVEIEATRATLPGVPFINMD